MSRFYITTPIYYVNAEPHLGHAYTTIVADAIARTKRLLGDDVFFLTGTDEHGQKVERAAKAAGVTAQEFTDSISSSFRSLFGRLNISNDDFIRTTELRHKLAAQTIWGRVRDAGYLYKAMYEGWYCTVDEVFVPETQLVDGRCPDCGSAVERLSEESYFFKLSAFETRLLEHYRDHPEFLTPESRRNEIITFIKAGLKDLSVSRTSFKWGIPVPDDPAHVMYVWFDALTNYLTAVGYGSDRPEDQARLQAYWPASLHLMGKEIVRQHAVYWPAFLMAADLDIPKRIVGHGWWLMNEAKMSKSRGNVVRPDDYINVFGLDAFRYFVLREMVLGQDANFSDEAFLTRYNADLANDLGNLVSRATTMIHRYCGGIVPRSHSALASRPEERELATRLDNLVDSVAAYMGDSYLFSSALREIWDTVSLTNKYIVIREPWALVKDPLRRNELDTTLYQTANALRVIGALIEPVMPGTAQRIRGMLGIEKEPWGGLKDRSLTAGTQLGLVEPLFPRNEQTVEELRHMSEQSVPAVQSPTPAQPVTDTRLSIDDFLKVELRTVKVLAAERVPNSRKLLKLDVDLGTERRTIVAGIADAYEPEALVGKSAVIVANLKPATLMGIESNGMILAAAADGGKPLLLQIDGDPAPGTRVR
jgi:methionyl-tRNA synthetase